MPDLTYREHRATGARGGVQTINRLFRIAGMEALRERQVRLHLTAIGGNGMVDPDIDRAYVIVTQDALDRILEAYEGLRNGRGTPAPDSAGPPDEVSASAERAARRADGPSSGER